MARINFEVKSELYQRFRDNCSREGLSVSEVIRSLMVSYNRRRNMDQYMAKVNEPGSVEDGAQKGVRRELLTETSDD